MTKQRTFKRRVRERMAKTGESCTAARRMLIAQGDRPDPSPPEFEPRGLRAPGERPDGFAVGASRTIAVPGERLFAAFDDEVERERWLPGADLRVRTATAPKTARYDWGDGTTRVIVGFDAIDESKSRVALSHERLPDADSADEMKAWWRERLTVLKAQLEGGEINA